MGLNLKFFNPMEKKMTKVCILQPNFIPWMGYLKIIESANVCIIYDSAQFSKNTFHNRNNIKLRNGSIFCWSLPLKRYKLGSNFNEVFVEYSSKDFKKLTSLIEQNFSRSNFYYILEEILTALSGINSLTQLNFLTIKKLCKALEIDTKFLFASTLIDNQGTAVEKILSLLESVNATSYVTTVRAKPYLDQGGFETLFDGDVFYNSYQCKASFDITRDLNINLSALSLLIEEVVNV